MIESRINLGNSTVGIRAALTPGNLISLRRDRPEDDSGHRTTLLGPFHESSLMKENSAYVEKT